MLIPSIAIPGISAVTAMSSDQAFVTEVFPHSEHGKSLDFIGTSLALGILANLLLGRLII